MLSNNQAKNIKQLHQKKFRNELRLFIAEGPKVVAEFIHSDIKIKEIYGLKAWIDKNVELLDKKGCACHVIDDKELARISGLHTPAETLAVCVQPEYSLKSVSLQENLFLYLDGIADPGNLGTIIRMAEWFGLDQVLLSETSADAYNPKVVQSSMGSLSRIKTIYLSIDELIRYTGTSCVAGAELKGENIYSTAFSAKTILVIGSESHGISADVKKTLTKSVSIPAAKSSKAESLNAATAVSILLSEIFRKSNFPS